MALAQALLLPRLVADGDAAQTTENIIAHPGIFHGALVAMAVNFAGDVVSAWGLYYLLAPVSRSLSLLAAWTRLVYTAAGVAALLDIVSVRALVCGGTYAKLLGADRLHAEVALAIDRFNVGFGFTLLIFALYLLLLGGLMLKARHIPKVLGALILLDGAGWLVSRMGAYFFPTFPLGFVSVTYYAELVFMVWLLVWGLRRDPASSAG
jgi:hypothetical protein